jgi:hypothetical protein
MSSTSCVVLTCFAGYAVFYYVKVSQVKNLSTPLRRACRDDQDRHWKTLEDPRTIIITRLGTKPIRFHNFVK